MKREQRQAAALSIAERAVAKASPAQLLELCDRTTVEPRSASGRRSRSRPSAGPFVVSTRSAADTFDRVVGRVPIAWYRPARTGREENYGRRGVSKLNGVEEELEEESERSR